jgi:ABC-type sugar transport system permease subunit
VAVPILFTDRTTFEDEDVSFVGFAQFTRLFRDEHIVREFWPALRRTFSFTILNTIMAWAFGLTLALLMYEIGFKGGLFTLIYAPMLLPGLVVGFMALMLFAKETGTVNLLLMKLGWLKEPINIRSGGGLAYGLPLFTGWQYAGWNLAIFLSGLLAIPRETIESAVVDGASYLQRLWHIYLPQMLPTAVLITSSALMGSFQCFDILLPLGGMSGNEEAEFLSIVIFRYGFSANKLALGLAMSIETLLPLMMVVAAMFWLQRRFEYEV